MKTPSQETIVGWFGAMLVGVAVTITFAYGQFETKEHSRERADTITARLDRMAAYLQRMDEKIDRLLEERHK